MYVVVVGWVVGVGRVVVVVEVVVEVVVDVVVAAKGALQRSWSQHLMVISRATFLFPPREQIIAGPHIMLNSVDVLP